MKKLLLVTLLALGAGQALAAGYNPYSPSPSNGPTDLTPGKNNSCPAGYQLEQRFKHCTQGMGGICFQGTGPYMVCTNAGPM